jgi:hypothetical protein
MFYCFDAASHSFSAFVKSANPTFFPGIPIPAPIPLDFCGGALPPSGTPPPPPPDCGWTLKVSHIQQCDLSSSGSIFPFCNGFLHQASQALRSRNLWHSTSSAATNCSRSLIGWRSNRHPTTLILNLGSMISRGRVKIILRITKSVYLT